MATCAFATVGEARAGYTGVATDAQRRPGVGGAGARVSDRKCGAARAEPLTRV